MAPQSTSAYRPYAPARAPGASPRIQPRYRVLVHRRFSKEWEELGERVGLEAACQFYDHVSQTPGQAPAVGSTTVLRGRAGRPTADGFSRTVHYEISGAGRIDYQYADEFAGGAQGDKHRVVRILTIDHGSH